MQMLTQDFCLFDALHQTVLESYIDSIFQAHTHIGIPQLLEPEEKIDALR